MRILPSLTPYFLSFLLVLVELQQLGPHSFFSYVISFSSELVVEMIVPVDEKLVAEIVVPEIVVLVVEKIVLESDLLLESLMGLVVEVVGMLTCCV